MFFCIGGGEGEDIEVWCSSVKNRRYWVVRESKKRGKKEERDC